MQPKTIRETINTYRDRLKSKDDLPPELACKIRVELSAILGNVLDEVRISEMEYNKKLKDCFDKEEKANRAVILAKTTPEYEGKSKLNTMRSL